ncbi:MAG TPA: Ig-like domain-containing protein [Gemmatimonadales bacterium]|nr:Ig-like domain-containing protein [Gemmatimonadales bacterium]
MTNRSRWSLVAVAFFLGACKHLFGGHGRSGGNASNVPVSVSVSPPTACLAVGQTIQLVATPLDAAGNPLQGLVVTWTSSNVAVAAVDANGAVRGVGPGSATITALSEGVTGTAAIALQTNTATAKLSSLWALASNLVFAVGDGGTILLYDGTSWGPLCSGTTNALNAMGPGRYVVGAGGTILAWTPAQHAWIAESSGTAVALYGLARTPPGGTIVTVGAGGTILHLTGTSWSPQASGTTNPLYSVGKVPLMAANYAVGAQGTILYYDGLTWQTVVSPTTQDLFFVVVAALTNVYAVGAAGTGLHWDGATWSALAMGTTAALRAIDIAYDSTFTKITGFFAVGDAGTIVHSSDGATWTVQTSGTSTDLAAVGAVSATDVFAAGAGGTIVHYDGKTWTKQR